MIDNYFFVDGSSLLAELKKVRRSPDIPTNSKFSLVQLASYLTGPRFDGFHARQWRRFVYYFVQDDENLRAAVKLPDFAQPGSVSDMSIEYCGRRIRSFEQARDWSEKNGAPEHVKECLYRSEKAVDTRICCDALELRALGKLDRLFLYTNDYDFVPLCTSLKRMGTNVNLFRLRQDLVNTDLAKVCDAFHVVDEVSLVAMFEKEPEAQTGN